MFCLVIDLFQANFGSIEMLGLKIVGIGNINIFNAFIHEKSSISKSFHIHCSRQCSRRALIWKRKSFYCKKNKYKATFVHHISVSVPLMRYNKTNILSKIWQIFSCKYCKSYKNKNKNKTQKKTQKPNINK